jgi:Cdc6-like AAA superfamily ATPase
MSDYQNPFEYEAANKLKSDQILDFYIEDFNYSRFVRSKRNVFLVGERGTGKTMTLLFNSLSVQVVKAEKEGVPTSLDVICVYVPCNTPLTHKTEYALLEKFQGAVISEHFLVMSIMYAIADTLSCVSSLISDSDAQTISQELEFVLGFKMPVGVKLFDGLKLVTKRKWRISERA